MTRADRRLQLGLTLVDVMVNPLRPFLLNAQIKMEARKIAHLATKTCKPRPTEEDTEPAISGDADEHTKNCNALTNAITELALQVKLASLQPSVPRTKGDDDDGHDEGQDDGEAIPHAV